MPNKYRQVLATRAERYADISEFLLTMDLYNDYAVRESSITHSQKFSFADC